MPEQLDIKGPNAISPKSDPVKAGVPKETEESRSEFLEAKKRFELAWEAERDQREEAFDDLQFCHVEEAQWDDYTRTLRKNRPQYSINRLKVVVNQLVGDMRQSQISSKVRPVAGEATTEMANMLNGLIRNIENDSGFDFIKTVAYKEAATGGFGAWQIVTEWNDEDSFDQSIKYKPIHSATTSVYFDPASRDECHRDAMFCFVTDEISKDEFKNLYGDEVPVSSLSTEDHDSVKILQDRDTIKVADYWVKEPYTKTVGYFSDGTVKEIDADLKARLDELAEMGITVVRERKVRSHKVVHYKMSGDRFIDGPNEWAGKHIPIVPLYGYDIWIEGQHYYHGVVRFAKDAQRIYNYTTSAKIEAAARAPQDPWMVTPRMIKGFEQQWQNFPNSNDFALPVNPDPMVPGGLPTRLGAPAMNNALIEQTHQADQDIQATTGKFSQTLGDNPRNQSGKALGIQREQGDLGTYEMSDNLARSVRYSTEILLDLIPKIYGQARVERILHEDGESEMVAFNQPVLDEETGEIVLIENDITLGKYDVVADIGPSYKSKRTEAADTIAYVMQTSPDMAPYLLDLLAKNMDFPLAPELEKRMRKRMLGEGIIEPNEQEAKAMQQKMQSPGYQREIMLKQKMQDLQLKAAEAEAQNVALDAFLKQVELMKDRRSIDLEIDQAAVNIDKTESEIRKNEAAAMKAEAEARRPISAREGVSPAKG